jgi:putative salt-induced outer membrane protein
VTCTTPFSLVCALAAVAAASLLSPETSAAQRRLDPANTPAARTARSLASAQGAPAPEEKPAREGTAEFAFVGTSGNSETMSIGIGGTLVLRPDPVWEVDFRTSYIRNESEDLKTAESFLFGARASRRINERLMLFGQYGYLRDRFAGIEHRNSIDGGVAYLLLEDARHKLVVDGSLGYANEQRLLDDDISTATAGAGGVYILKLSENAQVTEDAHFNFSLSDGADWRFTNIAGVTAKLTTLFSLKVTNTIRYVNEPALGFDSTDMITAVALVAKF